MVPAFKKATYISDRTYNLGKFQVTTTAFQVPWLEVKRKQNEREHWHPVIPGPLFIHYDSDELTYVEVFNQLNTLLRTKKVPLQIRYAITTDSELAMVKGCKIACPTAIHSLCNRHLRRNCKDQMKPSMPEERVEVLGKMFDAPQALVTIDDENEYQEAVANIDTRVFKNAKYFDDMAEKIWKSVIVPQKESKGVIRIRNNTNNVGK